MFCIELEIMTTLNASNCGVKIRGQNKIFDRLATEYNQVITTKKNLTVSSKYSTFSYMNVQLQLPAAGAFNISLTVCIGLTELSIQICPTDHKTHSCIHSLTVGLRSQQVLCTQHKCAHKLCSAISDQLSVSSHMYFTDNTTPNVITQMTKQPKPYKPLLHPIDVL